MFLCGFCVVFDGFCAVFDGFGAFLVVFVRLLIVFVRFLMVFVWFLVVFVRFFIVFVLFFSANSGEAWGIFWVVFFPAKVRMALGRMFNVVRSPLEVNVFSLAVCL